MPMPRRRRRWIVLLAVLALVLVAIWWIDRQLEPQRLTALVLRQAGSALGLDLRIDGEPQYALRPEPRLVLPHLSVRRPGELPLLLRARRVDVSLPWSTLLGTDAPATITRLELDDPELDLVLLRSWLDTRPATDGELPTLAAGLLIRGGRVRDRDWSLDGLQLQLPRLAAGEPLQLDTEGRLQYGAHDLAFGGRLRLARLAPQTGFDALLRGRWRVDTLDLPYELQASGDYAALAAGHHLRAEQLRLRSEDPLPDFDGRIDLRIEDSLAVALQGDIPAWRDRWPALPPPLSKSAEPLRISLQYQGSPDLSDPLQGEFSRGDTRGSTRLRWPELQAWLQRDNAAALLPPLQLDLVTPRIEIDGASLEGVRIRIGEAEPAQ